MVTYVSDSPSRWGERLVFATPVAVPAAAPAFVVWVNDGIADAAVTAYAQHDADRDEI